MSHIPTTTSSSGPAQQPTPLTREQAKGKIVRWYRNCKEARAMEHQFRSCVMQRNAHKDQTRFKVSRVITKADRQKLGTEVTGILRYYTTADGQRLLQQNPLADGNRDRWIEISHQLISDPSYIPIVVRDDQQRLQAVALVSMRREFYLEQLATIPENLGKSGKIRGGGSAAIEDALSLCARRGFTSLKFNTARSAVPFYVHLGFHFEYNHGSMPLEEFPQFFQDHGGRAKIDPDESDEKTMQ